MRLTGSNSGRTSLTDGLEGPVLPGQRNARPGPGLQELGLVLIDVEVDPDAAQVGDPEELRPLDELEPEDDVPRDDDARGRRPHLDLLDPFLALGQLVHLDVAHAHVVERVPGLLDADLGRYELGGQCVALALQPFQIVEIIDEGLLRAQDFGGVESGQDLVFLDQGPGRDGGYPLDPAGGRRVDDIERGLVRGDPAEDAQRAVYRPLLDLVEPDAGELAPLLSDVDRAGDEIPLVQPGGLGFGRCGPGRGRRRASGPGAVSTPQPRSHPERRDDQRDDGGQIGDFLHRCPL